MIFSGASPELSTNAGCMVQAACKPQPGPNFPDFNSVRTVQKVVEAVVEACECWSVNFGSWSGHLMMRLSESALF
jgi:hypothetical protein